MQKISQQEAVQTLRSYGFDDRKQNTEQQMDKLAQNLARLDAQKQKEERVERVVGDKAINSSFDETSPTNAKQPDARMSKTMKNEPVLQDWAESTIQSIRVMPNSMPVSRVNSPLDSAKNSAQSSPRSIVKITTPPKIKVSSKAVKVSKKIRMKPSTAIKRHLISIDVSTNQTTEHIKIQSNNQKDSNLEKRVVRDHRRNITRPQTQFSSIQVDSMPGGIKVLSRDKIATDRGFLFSERSKASRAPSEQNMCIGFDIRQSSPFSTTNDHT